MWKEIADESTDCCKKGLCLREEPKQPCLVLGRASVVSYLLPREEGEPMMYNTAYGRDKQCSLCLLVTGSLLMYSLLGMGWRCMSPAVNVLLLKNVTGAQVNGERRAVASCVLYTGHQ